MPEIDQLAYYRSERFQLHLAEKLLPVWTKLAYRGAKNGTEYEDIAKYANETVLFQVKHFAEELNKRFLLPTIEKAQETPEPYQIESKDVFD